LRQETCETSGRGRRSQQHRTVAKQRWTLTGSSANITRTEYQTLEMSKVRLATRLCRTIHSARRFRSWCSSSNPRHGGVAVRPVQDLLRNQPQRTTNPDTLHAEPVQTPRIKDRLNQSLTLSVLSFIVLGLSRRSSILRVEEIRFAPINRNAACDSSTAFSIVRTSRACRIVAIGVT